MAAAAAETTAVAAEAAGRLGQAVTPLEELTAHRAAQTEATALALKSLVASTVAVRGDEHWVAAEAPFSLLEAPIMGAVGADQRGLVPPTPEGPLSLAAMEPLEKRLVPVTLELSLAGAEVPLLALIQVRVPQDR